MKPIPDNIKEILGQLAGPQQVALRTYIASLRSEIKDLEAEVLAKTDPDPHAHYHGHEKVRVVVVVVVCPCHANHCVPVVSSFAVLVCFGY